jgi:hypothetical protein
MAPLIKMAGGIFAGILQNDGITINALSALLVKRGEIAQTSPEA